MPLETDDSANRRTWIEQAKANPTQINFGAIQAGAQTLFAQKVADLVKNPPPGGTFLEDESNFWV